MKFNIKAKRITLDAEIKSKIEEKINKVITQYIDDPATWVEVRISDIFGPRRGKDKRVSVTIKLPKRKSIMIVETNTDIVAAIELAKDRLEKALVRYKEKRDDKKRRISKEVLQSLVASGMSATMWPLRTTKSAFRRIFRKGMK